MNKRVGIWLRVSTEDQVRGESPEHHEKRARGQRYRPSRQKEVLLLLAQGIRGQTTDALVQRALGLLSAFGPSQQMISAML